jgi:hypothetical protein
VFALQKAEKDHPTHLPRSFSPEVLPFYSSPRPSPGVADDFPKPHHVVPDSDVSRPASPIIAAPQTPSLRVQRCSPFPDIPSPSRQESLSRKETAPVTSPQHQSTQRGRFEAHRRSRSISIKPLSLNPRNTTPCPAEDVPKPTAHSSSPNSQSAVSSSQSLDDSSSVLEPPPPSQYRRIPITLGSESSSTGNLTPRDDSSELEPAPFSHSQHRRTLGDILNTPSSATSGKRDFFIPAYNFPNVPPHKMNLVNVGLARTLSPLRSRLPTRPVITVSNYHRPTNHEPRHVSTILRIPAPLITLYLLYPPVLRGVHHLQDPGWIRHRLPATIHIRQTSNRILPHPV